MTVTGIAWYHKKEWADFRRLTGDRVEETHEEWQRNARKLCGRMNKKNVVVRKVPVDVSELALWCRANNKPCDTNARAEYVTWKLSALRTTTPTTEEKLINTFQ
jgi:hypothetical protein